METRKHTRTHTLQRAHINGFQQQPEKLMSNVDGYSCPALKEEEEEVGVDGLKSSIWAPDSQ